MAATMSGRSAASFGSVTPTARVDEPAAAADAEAAVGRFEDFFLREFSSIVGLAYALSGSSLAAEDIAQEAFMAASRSWERVGSYENFSPRWPSLSKPLNLAPGGSLAVPHSGGLDSQRGRGSLAVSTAGEN
jgi:hypothetical protein